jgi:hypothetical protein
MACRASFFQSPSGNQVLRAPEISNTFFHCHWELVSRGEEEKTYPPAPNFSLMGWTSRLRPSARLCVVPMIVYFCSSTSSHDISTLDALVLWMSCRIRCFNDTMSMLREIISLLPSSHFVVHKVGGSADVFCSCKFEERAILCRTIMSGFCTYPLNHV